MFEIVFIVLTIFLSVIGLSELLHRLWMGLIKPNKEANILITPLRDEDAAEQISAVLEEMRWFGKPYAKLLIGLDLGVADTVAYECRMLQNDNEDFIFCRPEEVSEILKQRS